MAFNCYVMIWRTFSMNVRNKDEHTATILRNGGGYNFHFEASDVSGTRTLLFARHQVYLILHSTEQPQFRLHSSWSKAVPSTFLVLLGHQKLALEKSYLQEKWEQKKSLTEQCILTDMWRQARKTAPCIQAGLLCPLRTHTTPYRTMLEIAIT